MTLCRCQKMRHATKGDAKRHLRRIRGLGKTHNVRALSVYHCPDEAGVYHVGHSASWLVREYMRSRAA